MQTFRAMRSGRIDVRSTRKSKAPGFGVVLLAQRFSLYEDPTLPLAGPFILLSDGRNRDIIMVSATVPPTSSTISIAS